MAKHPYVNTGFASSSIPENSVLENFTYKSAKEFLLMVQNLSSQWPFDGLFYNTDVVCILSTLLYIMLNSNSYLMLPFDTMLVLSMRSNTHILSFGLKPLCKTKISAVQKAIKYFEL